MQLRARIPPPSSHQTQDSVGTDWPQWSWWLHLWRLLSPQSHAVRHHLPGSGVTVQFGDCVRLSATLGHRVELVYTGRGRCSAVHRALDVTPHAGPTGGGSVLAPARWLHCPGQGLPRTWFYSQSCNLRCPRIQSRLGQALAGVSQENILLEEVTFVSFVSRLRSRGKNWDTCNAILYKSMNSVSGKSSSLPANTNWKPIHRAVRLFYCFNRSRKDHRMQNPRKSHIFPKAI